ncbi:transcription elongation factor GreA [Candidatus Parcubacteria bacterium]|nr:transcription elongation factor GreA [Candidatus Parcubacteria bacterium]
MSKKVLTQEGFDKLMLELEGLKTDGRIRVAERIKTAKEYGDLSENAEYQEAKEERAFIEGRIMELEHLTKTSTIVQANSGGETVGVGCKVKVEKDGLQSEFTIVGSTEADPANNRISLESPIGEALMDKKIGDIIEVELPSGVTHYKVLEIN